MGLALIKSTLIRATVPQDTLGENVKQVPNITVTTNEVNTYGDAQTTKLRLNNRFLNDLIPILVYLISYMTM